MKQQMNTDAHRLIDRLAERVIGGAYQVGNGLGCGFLEKVHESALAHELRKAGMRVVQQKAVAIYYDGVVAGQSVYIRGSKL